MLMRADSSPPERETIPAPESEKSVLQFEQAIREQGESRARWSRLMAILEEDAK